MMKLSAKAFDKAVERAIGGIPEEIRRHLDNVLITVRKRPTSEMLEELGFPPGEEPLGFYWGSSLAERSVFSPMNYPDTIFIFQEPLEYMCDTEEELEEQIKITVIHEVAHFLGIDEDRLDELGYG
jgi:predicted Zn-dependent protease with MMP-like domain